MADDRQRSFETFVRTDGERLRRVLASQYGVEVGVDAADAALAWAWEHWDRVEAMDNPAGYLYRVARTRAGRAVERGRRVTLPSEPRSVTDEHSAQVAIDLADALRDLTERQRVAVLMVHAYGWTPTELADLMGLPAVTIRSHLRRGLRRLRTALEKEGIR